MITTTPYTILSPTRMKHYLMKFTFTTFFKGFVISLYAFLALPIAKFLVITFALVLLDTYTGVRAAKARGESIRSNGLRRAIDKVVLYFIGILLSEGMIWAFGFPLEFEVLDKQMSLTYVVAAAICYIEYKSNIENIEDVTGAKIWDYVGERVKSLLPSKS